ncbi:protein of unknown function, partial (plasmid) [Azospirillum baldaniorum]
MEGAPEPTEVRRRISSTGDAFFSRSPLHVTGPAALGRMRHRIRTGWGCAKLQQHDSGLKRCRPGDPRHHGTPLLRPIKISPRAPAAGGVGVRLHHLQQRYAKPGGLALVGAPLAFASEGLGRRHPPGTKGIRVGGAFVVVR